MRLPRTGISMRELVLIQPGTTADSEVGARAAEAALRREFEELLAECGPLAFRVARGVLRNTADAEDVAQEALLRDYPVSTAFATVPAFGPGLCASLFACHWTAIGPANDARCAKVAPQSRRRQSPGKTTTGRFTFRNRRPLTGRSFCAASNSRRNREVKIVFCS
jgi:hypothetical protein